MKENGRKCSRMFSRNNEVLYYKGTQSNFIISSLEILPRNRFHMPNAEVTFPKHSFLHVRCAAILPQCRSSCSMSSPHFHWVVKSLHQVHMFHRRCMRFKVQIICSVLWVAFHTNTSRPAVNCFSYHSELNGATRKKEFTPESWNKVESGTEKWKIRADGECDMFTKGNSMKLLERKLS